jgi:hypothetical protein
MRSRRARLDSVLGVAVKMRLIVGIVVAIFSLMSYDLGAVCAGSADGLNALRLTSAGHPACD